MKLINLLKASFIAAGALLMSFSVSGATLPSLPSASSLTPYVGADAAWQLLSIQAQNKSVKHNEYVPKCNLYGGVKINEYAAVEVGTLIHKAQTVGTNKLKSSNYHASLVGTYPITTDLNIIGSAGLARVNHRYILPANSKKAIKTVPRLMGGVEYAINPNVKLRGGVTYQMTHNLKIPGVTPRDRYFLSGGLNYSF